MFRWYFSAQDMLYGLVFVVRPAYRFWTDWVGLLAVVHLALVIIWLHLHNVGTGDDDDNDNDTGSAEIVEDILEEMSRVLGALVWWWIPHQLLFRGGGCVELVVNDVVWFETRKVVTALTGTVLPRTLLRRRRNDDNETAKRPQFTLSAWARTGLQMWVMAAPLLELGAALVYLRMLFLETMYLLPWWVARGLYGAAALPTVLYASTLVMLQVLALTAANKPFVPLGTVSFLFRVCVVNAFGEHDQDD